MTNTLIVYIAFVFLMSIVTFVVYGFDKRQSGNGGQRVPERTLHILTLLGGWPGALLAQRYFRHKSKKTMFLIVFWIVFALHVVVVGAAAYVIFG